MARRGMSTDAETGMERPAQGKVGLYPNTNGDSSSPHKTRRMRERLVHGEAGDVPESKRGQEYSA